MKFLDKLLSLFKNSDNFKVVYHAETDTLLLHDPDKGKYVDYVGSLVTNNKETRIPVFTNGELKLIYKCELEVIGDF